MVWVMKSLFEAPVSALSSTWEMAGGAVLSTTIAFCPPVSATSAKFARAASAPAVWIAFPA